MSSQLDRMLYIDDSGNPQSGLVVYGWIECRPDRWAGVLQAWLETRKRLWRDFGIPVATELHTTKYVRGGLDGRDRIAEKVPDKFMHEGTVYWKDLGRAIAVELLETLRCAEGLRVGAVFRRGDSVDLAKTRSETYARLLDRFERELAEQGSLGMVFMDGDGSDHSYKTAHRGLRLQQRRVIEDPIYMDSRGSQPIQMADLVAWTAYTCINRHKGNEFAWDWYSTYLAERDPFREPQEV